MTLPVRVAALVVGFLFLAWTAQAQGQAQLRKAPVTTAESQPQSSAGQPQPRPEAVELQRKSRGIKAMPLSPGRPDESILQRDPGSPSFEQRVESMEEIQARLKQTLNDFEREHRKTLQAARRVLGKYEQCHERIYTQGSYTQAERDAACSSGDSEDSCRMKLLKRCIGGDADKYEQGLLALREKSDDVATLLAPYQRGRVAELR